MVPHSKHHSSNTCSKMVLTLSRRVRLPGAPSIQINVPAIYHNALPPNTTPSSSPGTLSTSKLYDCWQSNNFPFFPQQMGPSHAPYPCRPHHGHPPQNQRIPLLCVTDHSSGHTEEWESLTQLEGPHQTVGPLPPARLARARRPNVLSYSHDCMMESGHSQRYLKQKIQSTL